MIPRDNPGQVGVADTKPRGTAFVVGEQVSVTDVVGTAVRADWFAKCRCGWKKKFPTRQSAESGAAGHLTGPRHQGLPSPTGGLAHKATLLPYVGTAGAQRWRVSCECGWRAERTYAQQRVAEGAAAHHIRSLGH